MTNPFKNHAYMTTFEIVSVVVCALFAICGVALMLYGSMHEEGFYHGLRWIGIGATGFLGAVMWGATIAFGHRTTVLTRVYRDGYRQGRKDANHALLEEGLLLSLDEVAEQMYDEERNGNGD